MAGSSMQTIILFTLETKSPPQIHHPNFLLLTHHHCFRCSGSVFTVVPPILHHQSFLVVISSLVGLLHHLVPLRVFPTIIFAMPPHHHAVILGLAGLNGIPPMWPDPVILNSTPNPELVTIGANLECPTRGLVHSCCLRCTKAMVNNPALVCHHPTWWVNCLCCYWQHDKCHNVSAPVSILAPLIYCVGPEHLFPNPAPSAGGGGHLARG